MSTLPLLEDEMHRLVEEAQRQRIFLRLIGGLAVKTHCDRATHRALMRDYPDIDFVTDKDGADAWRPSWSAWGIRRIRRSTRSAATTASSTTTRSGIGRSISSSAISTCATSCRSPTALSVEPLTIPLAELFLSKAQIVQLNRKDVLDLLALLLDHDVGPGDAETINSDVIAGLCAKDWGLYTTVSLTIGKLREFMARGEAELLSEPLKAEIAGRLDKLQAAMDRAPKPMAWKLRARLGTKVPWYDEVEEVHR